MSPLKHWQAAFRVEDMRLPADAGELEIVCCEWDTAAVSHIGVEKANCVFNSAALQELRRRHVGLDDLCVEIKWNNASMRRIWVLDASTGDWISVPNRDAKKAAMSAAEVAMAKKLAQLPEDLGVVVARVTSHKARRALAGELASNKNQMKKNAMKRLGLVTEPSDHAGTTPVSPPLAPTSALDGTTTQDVVQQPSPEVASMHTADTQSGPEVVMTSPAASSPIGIPIFKVIRSASSSATEGRP